MTTPNTEVLRLSYELGLKMVDLRGVQVDPAALLLLSEARAQEHKVLPLGFDGDGPGRTVRIAVGIGGKEFYTQLLRDLSVLTEHPVTLILAFDGTVSSRQIARAYLRANPTP